MKRAVWLFLAVLACIEIWMVCLAYHFIQVDKAYNNCAVRGGALIKTDDGYACRFEGVRV